MTTFYILLLAPLPGTVWLQPLLAGIGAEAAYLMIRLVGPLGRPPACRTISYQLTTRRPPSWTCEVRGRLRGPRRLVGVTCALDLAAENYRLGFLRQPGWDEVRRYIWSYLELNVWSHELVGLGCAAREIDRICYADSDGATIGSDPAPGAPPGPR